MSAAGATKRRRGRKIHPDQLAFSSAFTVGIEAADPRSEDIRALAGCVILDEDGRVLLLHRSGNPIQWELPGGKVEDGEAAEAAAKRELLEELGVHVSETVHLGDASFL